MGWTNFVIIPKLKLAVEISRSIDELDEWEEESIEKALYFYEEEIPNKKITGLTFDDAKILGEAVKILNNIPEDRDVLFLFWLKKRNVEYEIISEMKLEEEKEKYKNYTFVRY